MPSASDKTAVFEDAADFFPPPQFMEELSFNEVKVEWASYSPLRANKKVTKLCCFRPGKNRLWDLIVFQLFFFGT